MDEFNLITEAIKTYGLKGGIFVVIITLIIGALKSSWFSNISSKLLDKTIDLLLSKKGESPKAKITESDIDNHDLFSYIDFWMYSKVPTMIYSTEYRTAVFRKYNVITLRCAKANIYQYIKSGNYKTMDSSTLWKSQMELINKIVFDYETELRLNGIPEVVIQKMKLRNNDSIVLMIDLIAGICNSDFYASDKNLLKIYSILNITLSILESTIDHSVIICNSINGELAGLTFEGKTEPTKKDH